MAVSRLREMVKDKTGVPTEEIRLIYGGKELDDRETLAAYPTLGTRATLFMVMRLNGGAAQADRFSRIDRKLRTNETCIISFEEGNSVKMPCGHAMDPDTLMDYCWNEIGDKKCEIHCPLCRTEWPINVLAKYGGADKRELTLLEEGLSLNYCEQNSEITTCPGCGYFCTRADTAKFSMQCRICTRSKGRAYRFCFKCHREWKNGSDEVFCGNKDCQTADQERARILRTCEEKDVVGVRCPSTRACPNEGCGALIQHRADCKHMKCILCKTEFCFICLRRRTEGTWQCGRYNTQCAPAPRQS